MDLMLNDLFPFRREVYLRFRESEQITGRRNEQIFGFYGLKSADTAYDLAYNERR